MRVLRLDLGRTSVELHPFVTVVRGLSPEVRARLLEVLGDLPAGRTSVGGLIEAHGVLLDLAPATLRLLDLAEPLDVVVRAEDLPGRGAAVRSAADPALAALRTRLAEADADVAAAEAQLAAAVDRARAAAQAVADDDTAPGSGTPFGARPVERDADADAVAAARAALDVATTAAATARARHEQAQEDLRDAEAAASVAREARRDVSRALSVAAAALETASERRDATAGAVVDAARSRLAEAEGVLEEVRAGASSAVDTEVDTEALQTERTVAQASLLALDTIDPLPVQAALDHLKAGGVDLVPVPEALALADELVAIEGELLRLPGSVGRSDAHQEERELARRRVELAQQALTELEAVTRKPVYDPADVTALEAAHLEVLEAKDVAGRRFGAAKAARRLEEAEHLEQEILDRMGLVTYTEYLMGAGGAPAPTQVEASLPVRLEAAREELARAEEQLAAREHEVADELARAELVERRRLARDAAVALLGDDPGDDLEGALRRLRVETTATGEHLDRLRGALEGAGLVLADEDVEERFLADLAKVWLHEQAGTEAQRRDLEQQIAEIDVQLAAAEARGAAPDLDEPLAVAAGAVEDARTALVAAEARLAREEATSAETDQLRAAFATASDADAAAAADLTAAEARVARAAEAVRAAAEAAAAAEQALATATANEASATASAAADVERLAAARARGHRALVEEQEAAEGAVALAEATREAALEQRRGAHAALEVAEAAEAARLEGARAAAAAPAPAPDPAADAEDLEWYLLARLAAQRSVSYAGSVPLVVDDALADLDPEATRGVLDRLERMAATVQVVLVTEDLTTAAWAEGLGETRAAVSQVGVPARS